MCGLCGNSSLRIDFWYLEFGHFGCASSFETSNVSHEIVWHRKERRTHAWTHAVRWNAYGNPSKLYSVMIIVAISKIADGFYRIFSRLIIHKHKNAFRWSYGSCAIYKIVENLLTMAPMSHWLAVVWFYLFIYFFTVLYAIVTDMAEINRKLKQNTKV